MVKIREPIKKFNLELRKSFSAAIVAAFGLLIALSWRDVIDSYLDAVLEASHLQGRIISAIIITVIGVLVILIVSKLAKQKE